MLRRLGAVRVVVVRELADPDAHIGDKRLDGAPRARVPAGTAAPSEMVAMGFTLPDQGSGINDGFGNDR
jgi:hypothetical protein